MATVSIKCPNCSGALELDDSKEFGFCIFCGTQVRVQDEKTRVEVSGNIKLDESEKYSNYLTLATRAFEAKNMSEAYNYYTRALEIRQTDHLPVFRKALCAGYLSDDFDLRIEEVVMGISTAHGMVSDPELKKNMSEEIVTFALSVSPQGSMSFYSSDECARYVKGVHNTITLLNRLYAFVDKDNAESALKYIEATMHHCKRLTMKSMAFIAGSTVKNGKSQNVLGTYPVPQNVLVDAADTSKRFAEEFNKYIRPKIEMVKSEIAEIKRQITDLPPLWKISHYACSWWVVLLALISFISLSPVVTVIVLVAQLVLLIVSRVQDKDKTAITLYKQLAAKKKELSSLNQQLRK